MRRPNHFAASALLLVASAVISLGTHASAEANDCPAGNLIAGRQPSEWLDVYHVERVTDEIVSSEGAAWNSDTNAPTTAQGYLIYDFGRPLRLTAFYLQAEGRGSYEMAVSDDTKSWSTLPTVPPTGADGMRARHATGLEIRGRYLRISTADQNVLSSIGEFAAWCIPPQPWPPQFEVRDGRVRDADWAKSRERRLHYEKLAVLALGALLLLIARRVPRGSAAIYIAVALAGAFAWTNFGSFHGPNLTHYHDTYHYLIGAEYFEENGYDGLYACTVWAERELGLERSVRNRYVTDLQTDRLVPGAQLLERAPACHERFSEARWETFREDIRFFRNNLYPGSWQRIFRDHGYNPTPVWTTMGKTLAVGRTAAEIVPRVVLLDLILWVGIGLLVLWAFGYEALALVFLTLGGGLPWEYFWNGGAFGRVPWLFCLVASVCLLKRERPLAAGFALGVPVLLRLFPAVFWIGPGVVLIWRLVRRRDCGPLLRLVGGGLLSLLLLVPLSVLSTGTTSWPAFARNVTRYAGMNSANQMGLPALFSFDSAKSEEALLTQQIESLDRWSNARRATFESRAIPYRALVLLLCALCVWTLIRQRWEPWDLVIAGSVFAVLLGQLNSYYYAFLILPAIWACARAGRSALLLCALALSQLIALAEFGTDVTFFWNSIVFVALPLLLWALRCRERVADG